MKDTPSSRRWMISAAAAPILSACVLAAALLARTPSVRSAAHAQGARQQAQRGALPGQDPQDQWQGGPPPGQGPGGPGGPGGFAGPGGMPGQMPFVMGSIKGIDVANRLITVATPFGGDDLTARIAGGAAIVKQAGGKASDLKVGETVQVQGIPTAISATNLTIGQPPAFMRGGFGGPSPGGGPEGNAGRRTPPQAFAMASGKVSSTSPLTVTIGDQAVVTLKLSANASITRFVQIGLADLKVGDRILLSGQMGEDGAFAATGAAVNLGMGGPGGPGFGGPMGPRNPGGPGGGPATP